MAGSWGRLWEKWGGRQHGEVLEMTNEGVQGGLNFAIIFSLSLLIWFGWTVEGVREEQILANIISLLISSTLH